MINSRRYITVENLAIEAVDSHGVKLLTGFNSVSDCKILNNDISVHTKHATNEIACISLYNTLSTHDIVIEGNDFSSTRPGPSTQNNCLIREEHYGALYNVHIVKNKFHDCTLNALWFFVNPGTLGTYEVPYGIDISDNLFLNIRGSAITTHTGLESKPGFPSKITGNIMKNIGSDDVPRVNAIQGQYLIGAEISYNYIDTVLTSLPDGAGIIIDWGDKKAAFPSGNVHAHHNIVTNCQVSGINVCRSKDNYIYSNYCFGNAVGLSVEASSSSGNVFFNNTSMFNNSGFRCLRSAPAQVLKNNLLAFNTDYALSFIDDSEMPAEEHNCIYGNGTFCDIAGAIPAATDILDNPKSGVSLQSNPGCSPKTLLALLRVKTCSTTAK